MFKTILTIFLGRAARAEEELETRNAAVIIEQKLREAEAGHANAKRGLARLIARCKSEQKALDVLEARISDLESRTREAVSANKNDLAMDAAKLLADLENERIIRRRTLVSSNEKADRIKLAIEKTHRQLIDLKQGLITARSIESERKAMTGMRSTMTTQSAISEGEAVLGRLLNDADPVAEMDALDELEASLSGSDVIDRLSNAGFGASEKVRPEDVLARFQSKPTSKKSKAG